MLGIGNWRPSPSSISMRSGAAAPHRQDRQPVLLPVRSSRSLVQAAGEGEDTQGLAVATRRWLAVVEVTPASAHACGCEGRQVARKNSLLLLAALSHLQGPDSRRAGTGYRRELWDIDPHDRAALWAFPETGPSQLHEHGGPLMARPKGTGLKDQRALKRMAELLVNGKATSRREAAEIVRCMRPPICDGKSPEAIRQRLASKYGSLHPWIPGMTYGESLEKPLRNPPLPGALTIHDELHEVADALAVMDREIERLDSVMMKDAEVMEFVEYLEKHPDELREFTPELIYYSRKFCVEE